MSRAAVFPGIEAPAYTTYELTTEDPAFDLSTVIAARLEVIFQDEDTANWNCTTAPIPGVPAANGIELTRIHDANDVPPGSEGFITVRAVCDLSGGGIASGEWRTIPVQRAGT